ncbi:hypothetical protein EXIGLDRAFT_136161 [Exidia glandulosa HHB12029]|uniref:Velvet domain-containing protein n=1 Tax=Exidia glandulosa HHB12029 TaxID=1314781 RepID=A0A165G211_EXIGL|nr:hypothetical protein EXIGLDRAFT_136161 [Exidia glandulosa HHB12029]
MRKDEVLDGSRDKQCEIKQAFREDEGVQAAYFVFDDLKVKERGHFVLRYTVMWFDPSAQYMGPWRTLGYTFGGVFAVFPSKKCPPVPHSTDLFLHLYRLGVVKHPKSSATTRSKKRKREASPGPEPEAEPSSDESGDEKEARERRPLSGEALLPSTSASGSGSGQALRSEQASGSGSASKRNASPPEPPRLASHPNHPVPAPRLPPMPAHLRLPWAPASAPLTFALQHPPRSPASASSSASNASPPPGSAYASSPTARYGPSPASPALSSASFGAPSPSARYEGPSSSPRAPVRMPALSTHGTEPPRSTSSAPLRATLNRDAPLTAAFASPSPTPVPPPAVSVHTARPSPTSTLASVPAPSSYPPTRRRLPFDPVYDA